MTTFDVVRAVEKLQARSHDGNFVGVVHPLQALWINRKIHPFFFPTQSELMEQTQADYDGWGINDPAVDVDVRRQCKAVTRQRSTR